MASATEGEETSRSRSVQPLLTISTSSGKANLDGHWIVTSRLVPSLRYYIQDSTGDVDIGPPPGPGKHGTYWHLFPEVAEDVERASVGGTLSVTDRINVGVHRFQVLDSRNTAEFDALGGTLTYNFGL